MENEDCGFLIKQIDSALNKRANANLKHVGVTLTQVAALEAIYSQPGCQVEFKQLEKLLRVSQPTTVGIISRLRDKGLLETFYSEESPNAKVASLTAAGKAICDEAGQLVAHEEETLLSGFDDDERRQFISMLQRVVDNVSD